MKVSPNGGLNLSCLDGWWPEAYNGENGWAIGDGRTYDDPGYQDHVECESLYNLLEREVVPTFYERSADDIPRRWIRHMKESLKTIVPFFNTNRMLRQYATQMYIPAMQRTERLLTGDFALAKSLAAWKERLRRNWQQVRVQEVVAPLNGALKVGDALKLRAKVHLGSIAPDDVSVEAYFGPLTVAGEINEGRAVRLNFERDDNPAEHWFAGDVPCQTSGRNGFAIRVLPSHEDLADRYDQGLVVWG
jgi:starch phosphorylase